MPRLARTPLALLVSTALLVACGGGDTKTGAPAEAKAQEPPKPAEDEGVAKRRAEREAKKKAEDEAAAAKKAAIEALAVLPPKLPKDIKKACEGVADAQLEFFKRVFEGPELEKLQAAQGTQRPMTVSSCTKLGSVEVAACQSHALSQAKVELKSEVSEIMRVCIEKFGKPAGG